MAIHDVSPGGAGDRSTAGDDAATVIALTDVLVRALRSLGNAGDPVAASQLGGKAWWILKDGFEREAERINGTMHFLARLEDRLEPTE